MADYAAMDLDLHPELERNGSFDHLKTGKLEPKIDARTLRFARYVDDKVVLPEIPDVVDYGTAVTSWPMYANDRWGDCTIAAAGHMIEGWTAAAGAARVPDEAAIEQAYIPGTGTDDTGRFELDVLNYWRTTGIGGDTIAAFVAIDFDNHDHVKEAVYLFGGVYIGVALPKSAQGQAVWDVVGDGKTGDSAPDSWGGHAVNVVGYDPDGVTVITWGAPLKVTWAFWDAYVDEAYAIVAPDFLNAQGLSPGGFDIAALQSDLAAITAASQTPAPQQAIDAPARREHRTTTDAVAAEFREESNAQHYDDDYFWHGTRA